VLYTKEGQVHEDEFYSNGMQEKARHVRCIANSFHSFSYTHT